MRALKVLPDLAKFRHFGEILKVFDNSLNLYLIFGLLLNRLGKFWMPYGQIFINEWGQKLKNKKPSGHTGPLSPTLLPPPSFLLFLRAHQLSSRWVSTRQLKPKKVSKVKGKKLTNAKGWLVDVWGPSVIKCWNEK